MEKKKSGVRIWAVNGRYYHQSYSLPFILLGAEYTRFLNITPGNFPQFLPLNTYLLTDFAMGMKGTNFCHDLIA